MKKIGFFIPFLLLFINELNAQKGLEWMHECQRNILDSTMNMYYTHNECYITDSSLFLLPSMNLIYNLHIRSIDGHFLTMFRISSPAESRKILGWEKNKEHIYQAQDFINEHYNKLHIDNWRDYVRYLSYEEAISKFNAETALYIKLPSLEKDSGYIRFTKGDGDYEYLYQYCSILIIHKKDRGILPMFFFYDEEGEKNLIDHLVSMENSFRYGEEPPAKEALDNECPTMVVVGKMKEKNPIIR